jgi:A/G-specific adenine glycosylase
MDFSQIGRLLTQWYQSHSRDLPWRASKDPYRIWISEVMLQQTRVETVIPYYARWMAVFPNLESLSKAGEQEVMQLWEGLGYYSRARNLVKAAHVLITEYQGKFPDTVQELKKLPGVGEYMAGALASIALGRDEIALDGNGLRVIARLVVYTAPINTPASKQAIGDIMRQMLPSGSAGDFNQAIMDLGSLICTPRNPLCASCPLHSECRAFLQGKPEAYPIKARKTPIPHYVVVAAVIRVGNKVLIDKRKADGLLGGLWEFPGGKVEAGEDLPGALKREFRKN